MAHLWVLDEAEHLIEVPLDGVGAVLSDQPPFVRPGAPDVQTATQPAVWLCRGLTPAGDVWVLVTGVPRGVLVNGTAVPAGIRVLDSRDEIRCRDGRVFVFSAERLARVQPFPGCGRPIRCARCTSEVVPSAPAVRCPSCGAWYHEHGEFPCWTSVPFCQACGHVTALASDTCWAPEEG